MIGNDIVDLHYAAQYHNWRRPGYLNKVFTGEERARIENSTTPDLLVWTLWSVKESAYKLGAQRGAERKYAPKQLVTEYLRRQADGAVVYSVCYEGNRCRVLVEQNAEYVHSVALPWKTNREDLRIGLVDLPFDDLDQQRSNLRQALYHDYVVRTGTASGNFSVQKGAQAVPSLFYNSQRLNLPLSLSHHGRFGAFAYLLDTNTLAMINNNTAYVI